MRLHFAKLAAAVCAIAATLPATASASAGIYDEGSTQPSASAASAGGTLVSRHRSLLGRTLRFRGSLDGADAGSIVHIQRLNRHGRWVWTASATVRRGGSFVARWRTNHIGRFSVRAVPAVSDGQAQAASAGPQREVTIYRSALATWYGPGFYGHRTACGRRLTRSLLGVAHPTLPCGTLVDLFYGGRTITVPVIDRGPFRGGVSWDLTGATAQALHFTFTDTIGAVALRRGSRASSAPANSAPQGGASAPSS